MSEIEKVSAIQVVRSETVLSRLPIHNLSKVGELDINIVRRNEAGEVELNWSVSHNAKYGPPRQLAYKIDTLIVNRRIDECGRPAPRVLRLGSLRELARELDLGGDTNSIRRALRQNAFTGISAKLRYRSTDGTDRRVEADFTRYSVVFAGERLPDGSEANAVYLVLHEPYLEVLNNAPRRPLSYDYMKQLPPAAQRFYEIVSYRIYAALKHGKPYAQLGYSEFCVFSALQRYSDYEHAKKQLYKIHKPHLDSGYIERLYLEDRVSSAGVADWNMIYVPGPRAKAEFEAFENGLQSGAGKSLAAPDAGSPLLPELTKRGLAEKQAKALIADLKPGQPVIAQLAWGDQLIARNRGRFYNPAGFYAYLIRENITPAASQTPPAAPVVDNHSELDLQIAYEQYKRNEADRYLRQQHTAEEYEAEVEKKRQEVKAQYPAARHWSDENLREVTEGMMRTEALERLSILSWTEFAGR